MDVRNVGRETKSVNLFKNINIIGEKTMEIDVKTVIHINLSDNQVREALRQYIGNKSDLSEYDLNRLSFVYTVTKPGPDSSMSSRQTCRVKVSGQISGNPIPDDLPPIGEASDIDDRLPGIWDMKLDR